MEVLQGSLVGFTRDLAKPPPPPLRAALRAVCAAGTAFEPKTVPIIKLWMAVKTEG